MNALISGMARVGAFGPPCWDPQNPAKRELETSSDKAECHSYCAFSALGIFSRLNTYASYHFAMNLLLFPIVFALLSGRCYQVATETRTLCWLEANK